MKVRRWLGMAVATAVVVGATLAVTGGAAQALPSECATLNRWIAEDKANQTLNENLAGFYRSYGYEDAYQYYMGIALIWYYNWVDDTATARSVGC